jgi:glyoxylase-like metal-dependent hydrolase (beta-lactamase superfamily II)
MELMKIARNMTLTVATLLLVSALASAQGGPGGGGGGGGPRPIAVHELHDGVYWTDGGPPSNTGFIVGTDGVIVFDPKGTTDAAKEVIADIAKVTPKPITTVIISHSNPDHTRGLPAYPPGVNVIMQQNAAREVEDLLFYYTWSAAGAGDRNTSIRPYLATQMVDTRADVKINGVNLRLLHWAPAHTSGDLVLYLPDQKIAFLGDIGGAGVHLENNGSSEGMIESVRGLIALDCDTYVRGHAPPATKADLQKGLDDLVARRDKIVALYEQGKSLSEAEQVMGEKVIPRGTPAIPGLPVFRSGRDMNFTEIVYTEMSRR